MNFTQTARLYLWIDPDWRWSRKFILFTKTRLDVQQMYNWCTIRF